MKNVLVTGAGGQLGMCIQDIHSNYSDTIFQFTDKEELDITNKEEVVNYLKRHKVDWCINCAAYTNVDGAEAEREQAMKVNVKGVQNLAETLYTENIKLVHISTDFVFDGEHKTPYSEKHPTNPINFYGKTKLQAEKIISQINPRHFIIRTSWLYSEHSKNFLKTILNLTKDREAIGVVADQFGSPTYAGDLAKVLLNIIITDNDSYGIYHYSNKGVISWYEFACEILKEKNILVDLKPLGTEEYKTSANRPLFSALDNTKIKQTFNLTIPFWRDSLKVAISKL